jgi:hypothetical protein
VPATGPDPTGHSPAEAAAPGPGVAASGRRRLGGDDVRLRGGVRNRARHDADRRGGHAGAAAPGSDLDHRARHGSAGRGDSTHPRPGACAGRVVVRFVGWLVIGIVEQSSQRFLLERQHQLEVEFLGIVESVVGIVVGQRCSGSTGCAACGSLETCRARDPFGGELSGVALSAVTGVTGSEPVAAGHAGTIGSGGRS